MAARVALLPLLLLSAEGLAAPAAASPSAVCRRASAVDCILGSPTSCLAPYAPSLDCYPIGVVEGDDAILHRALSQVYQHKEDYVAMLFYASWCPFSKVCRPNFRILSSLFPAIRHFAFEESRIRKSILTRYGVHGFPVLILLNSTMRVQYHGSRSINSLVAFYNNVTGINVLSMDAMSMEKIADSPSNVDADEETWQEACPFSWARSPEKLLQQDTYLMLASSFILLRLLCFLASKVHACVKPTWRSHKQLELRGLFPGLY